jgi:hypothetical protein
MRLLLQRNPSLCDASPRKRLGSHPVFSDSNLLDCSTDAQIVLDRADSQVKTRNAIGPSGRLALERYVLDVARGCLLRGDAEIALRPKTIAVL